MQSEKWSWFTVGVYISASARWPHKMIWWAAWGPRGVVCAALFYSIFIYSSFFLCIYICFCVGCISYLSSCHEKAIKALKRARLGVAAICLPHQDGGIPLSAFPNGTTSKLAGLFSTLSFWGWAWSREAVNTKFIVVDLTRLGIKPETTALETDTRSSELFRFLLCGTAVWQYIYQEDLIFVPDIGSNNGPGLSLFGPDSSSKTGDRCPFGGRRSSLRGLRRSCRIVIWIDAAMWNESLVNATTALTCAWKFDARCYRRGRFGVRFPGRLNTLSPPLRCFLELCCSDVKLRNEPRHSLHVLCRECNEELIFACFFCMQQLF